MDVVKACSFSNQKKTKAIRKSRKIKVTHKNTQVVHGL